MKVLKFGGTSVGSVEGLNNIKQIVNDNADSLIVVVSALSGVTNTLVEMTRLAASHDAGYEAMLPALVKRHEDIINVVVPREGRLSCMRVVNTFVNESLSNSLGVLMANTELSDELYEAVSDAIVSHGEILSSAIVSLMLKNSKPHFAPAFIHTTDENGSRIVDWASTEKHVIKEFAGDMTRVHVVQGFIAADSQTGVKTTLGRGGSDYTAAILAAILQADSLEIWTDVDGFYDSDPRTNPDARLIERMTYEQAQRLCDNGAKVIYPPTIAPVAMRGIDVWVKNTFNPTAPGTLITGK
mgnify:CR=1 FL=1